MLTTKELNRKVAGIRRSSAAIRENIHVVLVNLAGHAYEHGDVSVAVNLLNGRHREVPARQLFHTREVRRFREAEQKGSR